MLPFRAIFFDFDGVIAHTQPIMQQALWKFFREKKMQVAEKEYEEDEWASKSLAQVCDILAEKHDIHLEVNELRTNIWKTQKNLFEAGLESDPTLIPLLEYCRHTGIRVAIGSNSIRDRVEWVLKLMKIEEYFLLPQGILPLTPSKGEEGVNLTPSGAESPPSGDLGGLTVIGANDITHHKPDPEVWIKCAQMLGVDTQDCIAIDDHLPGLTGAKTAGIRPIYYHGFGRPEKACMEIAERSIESFSELLGEKE